MWPRFPTIGNIGKGSASFFKPLFLTKILLFPKTQPWEYAPSLTNPGITSMLANHTVAGAAHLDILFIGMHKVIIKAKYNGNSIYNI